MALSLQGHTLLSHDSYPDTEVIIDSKEYFDIGKSFAIVKNYSNYKEIYYFGADVNNHSINNIGNLECFICYFKGKAYKLIKQTDRARLTMPIEYLANNASALNSNDNRIISNLDLKRYYLQHEGHEIYLTRKEKICAEWLVQGKSTEEIANIIRITKRTVEDYSEHMKAKFGCYKVTELVYYLLKTGLIA